MYGVTASLFYNYAISLTMTYKMDLQLYIVLGDVYSTILKIYAEDKTEPLPGFEEVLLCSPETLLEEVNHQT